MIRQRFPIQSSLFILYGIAPLVFAFPNILLASSIRFTDITKSSGIDFTMTCGKLPSREILEVDGGGVAMIDYDNDGDWDLFFANGATMDDPEHGPGCRMYANRGDGTFENVTAKLGIDIQRWAMGVAVGDYDGDGWDDLYITCYGPNILLHNECKSADKAKFVDVTKAAGVGDDRWGASAAFGDIDGDGDLDLYVANYLDFDVKHPPDRKGKFFKGVPVMAGPNGLTAQGDVLYENLGNGTFRDITKSSGCDKVHPNGYGLGVRIFDYDGDGKQDIFVGNDSTENFLFHNLGGGKFEEVATPAGVATNNEGSTQAAMGIGIADVDGNGHPDIFLTTFSSDSKTLFANLGDGFFDDRTSQFGLGLVTRPFLSWGCGFYDFDGDMDEDLFVASGHVYPEAATKSIDSEYEQPVLIFERQGPRFEPVNDAGDLLKQKYRGRAAAFGDLDGDGDVDVVMTTLNGPVHIFRNDSPRSDALVVKLDDQGGPSKQSPDKEGVRRLGGNHRSYGARVELSIGTTIQRRWILGSGSFQSADAPEAYFSLGKNADKQPRTLRVFWPGGATTEIKDVPLNSRITLTRDSGKSRIEKLRVTSTPRP